LAGSAFAVDECFRELTNTEFGAIIAKKEKRPRITWGLLSRGYRSEDFSGAL
jgi:hypothetical protein